MAPGTSRHRLARASRRGLRDSSAATRSHTLGSSSLLRRVSTRPVIADALRPLPLRRPART